MTTVKKTVTKKKVKEVLSDEDKILGKTAEVQTVTEVKYESPEIQYKITNLATKNTPIIITGDLVETFIGTGNLVQREELKKGATEVITKDANGKEMYKIEVL
jgi:hypothetical protein